MKYPFLLSFTLAMGIALPTFAKNSLTLGMQLEPPVLDPTANAAAAVDEVVYANLFEGLTRFRPDGSIAPALAKNWYTSDDGLEYHFTLQEGVYFHDGAEFTAHDVKASLERALGPESVNAQKQLFTGIKSIEVTGNHSLVIHLKTPDSDFPTNLAWGDAIIMDSKNFATAATHPNGTGPFKFESWQRGQAVTLIRNETYWGKKSTLSKATFSFIQDPNAAFAALKSGRIDAFSAYPSPETLSLFEKDPAFEVLIGSTEGETIMAMNNARIPFNDVRIRRAINYALNREDIIKGAMLGYGVPIGSHFAPHHPDYVDLTQRYPHNLSKAHALLVEAGYPKGFEAELILPPADYARKSGEIIVEQLGKIGIKVRISNVAWAQWLEQVFRGYNYDMTIVSHTEPMDIGIYARDQYYFNYNSDAIKTLINTAEDTTHPQERSEALQAAQKRIAEDAVNVFLFQRTKATVLKTGLKGLWADAPTQANDITDVYWD